MTHLSKLGLIGLLAALFAILAAAGWYAGSAWISLGGPPMPTTGYVAMALGVVFSLAVGCSLMALVFYSARHGYDDAAHTDSERERSGGNG